jgi:hypothetical protein
VWLAYRISFFDRHKTLPNPDRYLARARDRGPEPPQTVAQMKTMFSLLEQIGGTVTTREEREAADQAKATAAKTKKKRGTR